VRVVENESCDESMITVVGDINVDYILKIRDFPDYDGDTEIEELRTESGGMAANTAYALKKLGTDEVTLIGCVGKDLNSQKALSILKSAGVNLTHVAFKEGKKTGTSFSIIDKTGVRRLMTYRGANKDLSRKDVKFSVLKNSEWIHMAGVNNDVVFKIVEEFPNVSWDPGWISLSKITELPWKILENIGILFLNVNEWKYFYASHKKHISNLKKIVVKKGENGVDYYEYGNLKYSIDAFHVKNVDSTGAGDVFNGAFLYSMIVEKVELRESLVFASAAAAISIGKWGTKKGVPTKVEVEKFILENR
jgi:ribokinase